MVNRSQNRECVTGAKSNHHAKYEHPLSKKKIKITGVNESISISCIAKIKNEQIPYLTLQITQSSFIYGIGCYDTLDFVLQNLNLSLLREFQI